MSKLSKAHKAFIVESAMDYLGVSDRNPEVGMGMFAFTAVDLAVAEFKETAELFGPVIDVSQAEKEFGFVAKTNFEQGLKNTINWYLNNQNI